MQQFLVPQIFRPVVAGKTRNQLALRTVLNRISYNNYLYLYHLVPADYPDPLFLLSSSLIPHVRDLAPIAIGVARLDIKKFWITSSVHTDSKPRTLPL